MLKRALAKTNISLRKTPQDISMEACAGARQVLVQADNQKFFGNTQ
jgi:hypothetical protein